MDAVPLKGYSTTQWPVRGRELCEMPITRRVATIICRDHSRGGQHGRPVGEASRACREPAGQQLGARK